MSVQKFLDKIKNGRYGADITDAIIGGIKKCYDDASVNHDNANMEVKMARGTHNTLNDRLDKSDEIQAQTNAQLSNLKRHFNNTIIVEDFGAVGDGVADDSDAFVDAIRYAHANDISVIKLTRQYRITKDLPSITKGIFIEGVEQSSHEDNFGTMIIDERQSNSYLIKYDGGGNNVVGGGLKRLRIKSVGDFVRHCVYTKGTGWEFTMEDVFIYGYNGTAIYDNSNDATFNRVSVIECGTRIDGAVHYALEVGTNKVNYIRKTNAQHFNSCHFEHCRFIVRINNAFLINFIDCKFEQSANGINVNSNNSAIHIGSAAQINFETCQFVPIGVHEYGVGKELYFINAPQRTATIDTIDQEALKFVGCSLMVGIGSGGSSSQWPQYKAALFLKSEVITLISDCSFSFLSGIKPSFDCSEDLIFTNNVVYMKGYDYTGTVFQNYNDFLGCLQCGKNSIIDNNVFFLMNKGDKKRMWCINPTSSSVYIGYNVYRDFNHEKIFANNNFITSRNTMITSGNLEIKHRGSSDSGLLVNHGGKSLESTDETYSIGRYGKFWDKGHFKQITVSPFGGLPSTPVEGMIAYDSVNKRFCGYNGTSWKVFDN